MESANRVNCVYVVPIVPANPAKATRVIKTRPAKPTEAAVEVFRWPPAAATEPVVRRKNVVVPMIVFRCHVMTTTRLHPETYVWPMVLVVERRRPVVTANPTVMKPIPTAVDPNVPNAMPATIVNRTPIVLAANVSTAPVFLLLRVAP